MIIINPEEPDGVKWFSREMRWGGLDNISLLQFIAGFNKISNKEHRFQILETRKMNKFYLEERLISLSVLIVEIFSEMPATIGGNYEESSDLK
jgi:hypothetical protein